MFITRGGYIYSPSLNDRDDNNDKESENEMSWLLALISNTGQRLSEAAGLHTDDIIPDAPILHNNLTTHPWLCQPLKFMKNACNKPAMIVTATKTTNTPARDSLSAWAVLQETRQALHC